MTSWPDKTLIRIVRGREYDEPVSDVLATRDGDDEYLLATGPRTGNSILRKASSDDIDEWEEVTAVPTAALKRLQGAFRGIDVIESLEPPLLEVLSYLSANKPSPLDRAVARVLDAGGPMVTEGDPKDNKLSLLFDALASVAVATNKAAPLVTVARICVDWADLENPRRDSLEVMRRRVEVLSDSENFIALSALVADVITALCENLSPRHDLIDAGTCALAWAAHLMEGGDRD